MPSQIQTTNGELTKEAERYRFLAEGHLISRCMVRQGYEYIVRTPPESALTVHAPALFHTLDPDEARTHGYGNPDNGADEVQRFVSEDPNAAYAESLDGDRRNGYDKALFGSKEKEIDISLPDGENITTNTDGCTSEMRRALYGTDLAVYLRNDYIADNLGLAVYQRVTADPAYTKALARWQRCMRDRSYHFDGPGTAVSAATKTRTTRTRPAPNEIAIAVADGECRTISRLSTTLEQLTGTYRERLAKIRALQLDANRRTRVDAIQRAGTLLS
ncbi:MULTISPECIES: hypothetical protein [unclassified Streptomyces]|uniref:hypothetical protein n=1 Tax=unclassified Streptomyces TaxID=2593676 RepID=UPI001161076C|nr:hypothetical protein [Streptomyces sp. TSRI0281]